MNKLFFQTNLIFIQTNITQTLKYIEKIYVKLNLYLIKHNQFTNFGEKNKSSWMTQQTVSSFKL